MDHLGYSLDIIRRRRILFHDFNFNLFDNCTIVGSKGEGIARFLESDRDFIIDCTEFYCSEDSSEFNCTEDSSPKDYRFEFRLSKTHAGYGSLVLKAENEFTDVYPLKKGDMLSQRLFQELFKDKYLTKLPTDWELSGPAFSFSVEGLKYDYVGTISFYCPELIKEWTARQRDHKWPPKNITQKISKMDGNLVAIGCKSDDCEFTSQEWRICFNEIEALLVSNLNETQTKLYQILKMIKTDHLATSGFRVTSFMLKNIIFWLAEKHPQSHFKPNTLLFWVRKALEELKTAATKGFLPYYMIPERNILAEKITPEENQRLVQDLDILILKEHCGLDECRIFKELEKIPRSELSIYEEKRNMLEVLVLSRHNRFAELSVSHKDPATDSDIDEMENRIEDIKASDWPYDVQIMMRTHSWEYMEKMFFG